MMRYNPFMALKKIYQIHLQWDAEGAVWIAESEDIPGLATEAATVHDLMERVSLIVPELIRDNVLNKLVDRGACPTLRFITERQIAV